jgi:hypothetical protein
MKRDSRREKLKLARETLVRLSGDSLAGVRGGKSMIPDIPNTDTCTPHEGVDEILIFRVRTA